jgi:hypothetical protein
MSRKSKREIERDLKDLTDDDDAEEDHGPLIMNFTSIREPGGGTPTLEDSPHPEVTVQSWPDSRPEELKIAIPYTIVEPWCDESILSVHTCEDVERYGMDIVPDGSCAPACELWDALDDEQLKEERRIREEEGEPIPELLLGY